MLTFLKQQVVQGSIEMVPVVLGSIIISNVGIPGRQESTALGRMSHCVISVHILGKHQQPNYHLEHELG